MSRNQLILGLFAVLLAVLCVLLFAISDHRFEIATHQAIDVDGKRILAVLSPDRSQAVWASDLDGEWDVYLSDHDGTNRRNLTAHCDSWDISPDWSPLDQRIAFASARIGNWQIFSMDTDGNRLRQLTHEPYGARLPRCGPQGKMAYSALHQDAKYPDYRRSDLVAIDGLDRQVLVEDIPLIDFAWSPDGKRIACGTEGALLLVNVATGQNHSVQLVGLDVDLYNHGTFNVRWRSDGNMVACLFRFLGQRRAPETVFPGEDRLYLASPGGNVQSVPLAKLNSRQFDWVTISPDIPIQLGKTPIDPRVEKRRMVSFFAAKGFPLKEIGARGNAIEYAFLVGPEFKYAIGISVLLNAAEEKKYADGLMETAIPAYVKRNIVLWNWDPQASTNGDPQFQHLFGRMKKALDDYPGREW